MGVWRVVPDLIGEQGLVPHLAGQARTPLSAVEFYFCKDIAGVGNRPDNSRWFFDDCAYSVKKSVGILAFPPSRCIYSNGSLLSIVVASRDTKSSLVFECASGAESGRPLFVDFDRLASLRGCGRPRGRTGR